MASSRMMPVRSESAPGRSDNHAGVDSLPLKAALSALRRRKWLILASVGLSLAICVAVWFFVAPRYTATTSVLLDPREIRLFDTSANTGGQPKTEDYLAENQLKVLGSRANVQQMIDTLGLARDPEFNPSLAVTPFSQIGAWLRQFWGTPGAGHLEGDALREAVFQRTMEQLRLRREGQSNVLTVSFTSMDPVKAAQAANALVAGYLTRNLQTKQELIARAQQSIDQQLAQIRSKVEDADRAVERYRAEHQLTPTTNDDLAEKRLSQLKSDLVTAHAERIAKDARVQEIQQLRAKGQSYKPVTELASSPIVGELVQRQDEILRQKARLMTMYGPRHPLVVQSNSEEASIAKKLDHEIDNIVHNFMSEALVARAKEQALTQAIDDANSHFAVDGSARIKLRELEREVLSKRSVYEGTLVRFQQMKVEASVLQPDAQLISAAVPPDRPSFPRLGMLTAIGSVASLAFGTLLAGVLEHLDTGLRTGRQIEAVLGIPHLGLTPRVTSMGRGGTGCQYILEKPLSAYADAVKTMFMRLQWASATDIPPRVLMITSACPGEGKTTLAMSLAAVPARWGRKTIVIDLDLRNPGIADQLGEPVDAGLVDVLCGKQNLDDVIRTYPDEPNLHVLPAGRTDSPAYLLESRALASLVYTLRARYDYVLLDSPPILGCSDTNLIAALPDAVLFVVQWEKTKEAIAATGLEALMRLHAPVLGAALTQVNVRRQRNYGDGDVGQYYGKYITSYEN